MLTLWEHPIPENWGKILPLVPGSLDEGTEPEARRNGEPRVQ